jgi:tetratricopeptide (TPR) repeat protein
MELGQLHKAKAIAEEAVEYADHLESGDVRLTPWKRDRHVVGEGTEEKQNREFKKHAIYERVVERCVLGAVLHQLNKTEARHHFEKAESILKEAYKEEGFDTLFTLWGFRYCEFLLDAVDRETTPSVQEALRDELLNRIQRMEDQKPKIDEFSSEGDLGIGPALYKLTKLRVELSKGKEVADAEWNDVQDIVKELHSSKRTDFNAGALVTAASVCIKRRKFKNAFKDAIVRLRQAKKIAHDGKMKLQKVDCQLGLGFAYMALAKAQKDKPRDVAVIAKTVRKAKANYKQAKQAIKRLEYDRRKDDLMRLKEELDTYKKGES